MDTLEGIQRLCEAAKREPVPAFDVVESVCSHLESPAVGPVAPPSLVGWKISAAVSALAAMIPLALVVRVFPAVDDFMIVFFSPSQGVWPW